MVAERWGCFLVRGVRDGARNVVKNGNYESILSLDVCGID